MTQLRCDVIRYYEAIKKSCKELKIRENLYRITLSDKLAKSCWCDIISLDLVRKVSYFRYLDKELITGSVSQVMGWAGAEKPVMLRQPREKQGQEATLQAGEGMSPGPWSWAQWKLDPQRRCSHCWKIPPKEEGHIPRLNPSSHSPTFCLPTRSHLVMESRAGPGSDSRTVTYPWTIWSQLDKKLTLKVVFADGITYDFYFSVFRTRKILLK